MYLFLMQNRRIFSLIIVVALALLITKIVMDEIKPFENKVMDGNISLKYENETININKYINKLLEKNVTEINYTAMDLDEDNVDEVIFKYFISYTYYYDIIHKEGKFGYVYQISSAIDLSTLKVDRIFQKSENEYARIAFKSGAVYSKAAFYTEDGKYYIDFKEVTKEEYEANLKKHEGYNIVWTKYRI